MKHLCTCESPNLALGDDRIPYCFTCDREIRKRSETTIVNAIRDAATLGVVLSPESVEAVAQRVTGFEEHQAREVWESAEDFARWLGRTPEWVRGHGSELGGVKDGEGTRGRWRFLRSRYLATLPDPQPQQQPSPQPLTRKRQRPRADLLPVRSEAR